MKRFVAALLTVALSAAAASAADLPARTYSKAPVVVAPVAVYGTPYYAAPVYPWVGYGYAPRVFSAGYWRGPVFGGRHQPGAGFLWDACGGPPLKGGQQGFLRQILCQWHIAQQSGQTGDQPGLLDPPDGKDRAMDRAMRVGGRHGRDGPHVAAARP